MKVENGEEFYGSGDIDYDGGYFTNNALERNFVVKMLVQVNIRSNILVHIELEISLKKLIPRLMQWESLLISLKLNLIEDTLNNTKSLDETYKDTQDYRIDRELAYRNIEKLQPSIIKSGLSIRPINWELVQTWLRKKFFLLQV